MTLALTLKIMSVGLLIGCFSVYVLSFPMKWRLVWPMPLVGATGAVLALIICVVIGEFVAIGEEGILIAAVIGACITSAIARYATWLGARRATKKGGNADWRKL